MTTAAEMVTVAHPSTSIKTTISSESCRNEELQQFNGCSVDIGRWL
jgi:hypothetical protein